MSILKNNLRVGNFTSSEIVALTTKGKTPGSFGKPAITYIEETNFERKLGRSLTDEVFAKPLMWGKLLEAVMFDKLGIEYILTSNETVQHPTIEYWAGSKDGKKEEKVRTIIDIKAPLTLKSFCRLVQALYLGLEGMEAINYIRNNHPDGEKYYWQLVSNAVIEDAQFAELIVYMPYEKDIPVIKDYAQNVSGQLMGKYYWVTMAMDGELPYIKDDGLYTDINIIRFEVPQADKDFLTDRVLKAGEMLNPYPSVIIAEHDPELNAIIIS